VQLHNGREVRLQRSFCVQGTNEQGEADLDRVIEAARIEAGEGRDFVEPVTQGVAMDREVADGRGGRAIGCEKRREGV
jgi:hypothetical protein